MQEQAEVQLRCFRPREYDRILQFLQNGTGWLWIEGQPGCGKSYTMTCALQEYSQRSHVQIINFMSPAVEISETKLAFIVEEADVHQRKQLEVLRTLAPKKVIAISNYPIPYERLEKWKIPVQRMSFAPLSLEQLKQVVKQERPQCKFEPNALTLLCRKIMSHACGSARACLQLIRPDCQNMTYIDMKTLLESAFTKTRLDEVSDLPILQQIMCCILVCIKQQQECISSNRKRKCSSWDIKELHREVERRMYQLFDRTLTRDDVQDCWDAMKSYGYVRPTTNGCDIDNLLLSMDFQWLCVLAEKQECGPILQSFLRTHLLK